MALNLKCANLNCPKHLSVRGGQFIYSRENKAFYCSDCFYIPAVMNPGKDLWHFTTRHFNGEPIEVKGGAHLDQLCRQFGVSNQARENMESHWNDAPSVRPQPMHPELERLMGKAREMGHEPGGRVSGGWNETHR